VSKPVAVRVVGENCKVRFLTMTGFSFKSHVKKPPHDGEEVDGIITLSFFKPAGTSTAWSAVRYSPEEWRTLSFETGARGLLQDIIIYNQYIIIGGGGGKNTLKSGGA
jgi:hypothetical protein